MNTRHRYKKETGLPYKSEHGNNPKWKYVMYIEQSLKEAKKELESYKPKEVSEELLKDDKMKWDNYTMVLMFNLKEKYRLELSEANTKLEEMRQFLKDIKPYHETRSEFSSLAKQMVGKIDELLKKEGGIECN